MRLPLSRREFVIATAGVALSSRPAAGAMGVRPRGDMFAFTSGIGRYAGLRELKTAEQDAQSVAERLEGIGYAVTQAYGSTRAALEAKFETFLGGIKQNATVFLYLAGHGLQLGGVNLLLPSDADVSTAEAAGRTAIPLATILRRVSERAPRQCIAIIDACRDNPGALKTSLAMPGLASVSAPNGFYIAYAAGSGEGALDSLGKDDPSKNGVFCRYFLDHLDGRQPIDRIIKETRAEVTRVAMSIGHRQHPAIYDQTSGEVCVDGQPIRESAAATVIPQGGVIRNCKALVIGVSSFARDVFPGTLHDARNFGLTLDEAGVDAEVLIEPGHDAFLAALESLAKFDGRKLIYFAGPGYLERGEGYLVFGGAGGPEDYTTAARGTTIAVGEIVERLSGAAGPALVILDTGLPDPDVDLGGQPGDHRLTALARGNWPRTPGEVSVLYACQFHKTAADQQRGALNSPFEIALANALARPGMMLDELADLVRQEVQDMTGAAQTPMLISPPAQRRNIWVEIG